MIRPTVRDKLLPDALRQGLLQSVLVFALSAARVGGIYAPWALAAAAVSGGKSRGLWALLGAGVGALVFFDFQTGLRFAASAVLIYSANMAFCDTKMYARKGFAPLLAALALLLVQSVYLVGRSAAQWALGVSASAVAAAVACGLDESRENGRLHLLVVMTAAAAALSAVQVEGFSPGSMTAAWLALLCAVGRPPMRRRWVRVPVCAPIWRGKRRIFCGRRYAPAAHWRLPCCGEDPACCRPPPSACARRRCRWRWTWTGRGRCCIRRRWGR